MNPDELRRLFQILQRSFEIDPAVIPTSVETSPKTATIDRLAVLSELGVTRISIGVQSFLDEETRAIGRPQSVQEVHSALQRIRTFRFPILNIDLIYGQPLQTLNSWLESLGAALQYQPEEIFLYPLYVRAETGLARQGRLNSRDASFYRDCYDAARSELFKSRYEQLSMRYFRKVGSVAESGPSYCCQSDCMLGLGAGARSYTSQLHYSSRFAVASDGVRAIVHDWTDQTDVEFGKARWGIRLSKEEQQRRFVIQSLLHRDGLDEQRFFAIFGVLPEEVIPELAPLADHGLIQATAGITQLTEGGVALSDAVGPSLYSKASREALLGFMRK